VKITKRDGDAPDQHVGAAGGGISAAFLNGTADEGDILARPVFDSHRKLRRSVYFTI